MILSRRDVVQHLVHVERLRQPEALVFLDKGRGPERQQYPGWPIDVVPVARVRVRVEGGLELDARPEVEAAVTAPVRAIADAGEPPSRLVVRERAHRRVEDGGLIRQELVAARAPDGRTEALVDLRQVDADPEARVHLELVVLVPAERHAGTPVRVVLVFRELVVAAEHPVDVAGGAADTAMDARAH